MVASTRMSRSDSICQCGMSSHLACAAAVHVAGILSCPRSAEVALLQSRSSPCGASLWVL